MILGIDIGGSSTKIIGMDGGSINAPLFVRATDPVASLFGAFGKFVDTNGLELSQLHKIMITGVGASYITKPIYGIPTQRIDEFQAVGAGGLALSGLNEAIVVSMGTGTAIIRASKGEYAHLGGTGIGGGTIIGLAGSMLGVRQIETIIEMAERGNLRNIDLAVGDISKHTLPGLTPTTTASNFGKVSETASPDDIAVGILNMVFQSIGLTARFAMLGCGLKDVVLTGNLSTLKTCRRIFKTFSELFGTNILIPQYSEFATALGAALSGE